MYFNRNVFITYIFQAANKTAMYIWKSNNCHVGLMQTKAKTITCVAASTHHEVATGEGLAAVEEAKEAAGLALEAID